MTSLRRLVADVRAASAAEFAIVLPLLLLFIFGVIDAGRCLWDYNRAEKATQVGARFAAVTDLAAGGLAAHSFAIDDAIPAGSTVPAANFSEVTCTASDCDDCTGSVCDEISLDGTAFNRIADRMIQIDPLITRDNVEISYRNVGLGFAGDPNGSDVSPLITVSFRAARPLRFQPLTTILFGLAFNMPDFRASVTGEDLAGSVSN
jgi:hypothetical protein